MAAEKDMNIAVFIPTMAGGGVERVHLDLAHECVADGHSVEFVFRQASGAMLAETAANYPIVALHQGRPARGQRFAARQGLRPMWRKMLGKTRPDLLLHILALTRYLRKRRPDVLLTATWPCPGMAVAARWLARVPCRLLVSEHLSLRSNELKYGRISRLFRQCIIGLAYRGADACVAVSHGVAAEMTAYTGIAAAHVHTIHNPVALPPASSPAALAAAERHWLPGDMPRLLCIGRLTAQKNHQRLLKAVALLNRKQPVQLMIVGEGDLADALRALRAELGLDDTVQFIGFQQAPVPFYRTADVFVLSSNYEGLPVVLLESLACGLPIVATDCPHGPAEALDNGRFGTLVPLVDAHEQDNVRALADGIRKELQTKRDPDALIARAAEFTPQKTVAQYLELMQRTHF